MPIQNGHEILELIGGLNSAHEELRDLLKRNNVPVDIQSAHGFLLQAKHVEQHLCVTPIINF